jgi:hypothetical protein
MMMFSFGDRYDTVVRLDQVVAIQKELNRIILYFRATEKPFIVSYPNQEDCDTYYDSVINTMKRM